MDNVRRRMEREIAHEAGGKRLDFKTGRGGLADIDFLVQLIQIREGHDRPEFRVAGTRRLLFELPPTRNLPEVEAEELRHAYRFLQKLELFARMEADASVSWISASPADVEALGRRMGMPEPAGERLLARYQTTTAGVRAIYRRVLERLS
jgi:glutamate-ammonia-ligase adenylyltransferase